MLNDKNINSNFTISNYMLDVVLPKCSIAYGNICSSVYLQIAFNINKNLNLKRWQHFSCWKSTSKIAKEIGCSDRKVKYIIKKLIEIELIEEVQHKKLRTYKLLNDQIDNQKDLIKFLNDIDSKILSTVSYGKRKVLEKKFQKLNEYIDLNNSQILNNLLKQMVFPDINFIKEIFIDAEKTYKGSSLFFIKILNKSLDSGSMQLFYFDNPLIVGCSRGTLSRYIYVYNKSNIMKKVDKKISDLLNNKSSKEDFNNNNDSRVVIKLSEQELYCPICKKEFKTARSLGMHLGKSLDDNHVKFNELRKQHQTPYSKFQELYEQYKELFVDNDEEVIDKNQNVKTNHYMNIPCECKISCEECYKNWFEEFYKECERPRKKAFIEEFNLNSNNKEQNTSNKQKQKKRVNHDPNSAPGLLKVFYDLTGTTSPNWVKECAQIKNQLKKGLTPEQIKIVFKHMARKGHIDLRFFSTSINDALLEHRYLQEMEQEGTAAYLVKYFYNGHGLDINLQTFVKEVQKIQETLNSGLSYEETKIVLDYMIEQKCTIINFIASKRTEALAKYRSKLSKQNNQLNKEHTFRNNPSFFDQDEFNIIKDDLIGGRIRINKIKPEYQRKAIEFCKEIFKQKKISSRYTLFEWAWRIGLDLDYEMYKLGLEETKETYLDFALRNSEQLPEEKVQILHKLKASFEKWLEDQHQKFNNIKRIK